MKNIFKKKRKEQQPDNTIDFADKYLYGDNYSDKFDPIRGKDRSAKKADKERRGRILSSSVIAVCSVVAFCLGYFIISVNMERKAFVPENTTPPTNIAGEDPNGDDTPSINDTNLQLVSKLISSDYLDAGAMINATIEKAVNEQYNSVVFDIKRPNGSLSYNSKLTLAETFNAVSSPGFDVSSSIKTLLENSIIPIATIYCFSDNTAPLVDSNIAVKTADGSLWKDKNGNFWLNPYSDIAVDYLVSIAKETAEMGIKNIILDGVSFPNGDLSKAVFGEGIQQVDSSKLDEFVAKVRAAVPSDCRVSVASRTSFADPTEFEKILPELKDPAGALPIVTSTMPPTDALKLLSESGVENYILVTENPEPPEN